jgi:hypothetical protein
MSPVLEMLTVLNEAEQIKKDLLAIMQIEASGIYPIIHDLKEKGVDVETVSCFVNYEPILVNINGKRILIDFSAAPICDDQDEIISVVLTIRDIPARKQYEIELLETLREKEILQLMINGSST